MRFGILPALLVLAACADAAAPSGPAKGAPPPAGGVRPRLGGCDIFQGDNAWNRDVSADPVDPASDALIAAMSPDAALHLDLGTTEEYYGIPYSVVPASQPLVPISYGTGGVDYSDESDPGPMPIPLDAPIEGGSAADPDPASGDRHVLVLQEGSCTLYELYNTERVAGGFRVSSSATWDLTVNDTRRGSYADAARPPYGLRVRLKASFDLSGYAGHARTVLAALKTYGLILADQGSAWYVTGTSHPGWENALDQLRARPVRGRDFEVVRMGSVTTS